MIYCVIPAEFRHELHEELRQFFLGDDAIEVVVDRRLGDRRVPPSGGTSRVSDRRRRARRGSGQWRAARASERPARMPELSPEHLNVVSWIARQEPAGQDLEDRDSARLAAAVQRGDDGAFAVLYLRYFDRIYAHLFTMLVDPHESEDLAQEVFVRAYEALPRYTDRGGPSFRRWLLKIARNLALMKLRGKQAVLVDPNELMPRDAREPDPADVIAPEDLLARDVMRIAATSLSATQRQILHYRYSVDLTRVEIARLLGTTPDAVRMQEKRALAVLRQRLTALRDGRDRAIECWR